MKKSRFVFLLILTFVFCSFSGIGSLEAAQGDDFTEILQQVDKMKTDGATYQDIEQFLNSKGIEVLARSTMTLDARGNEVGNISTRALSSNLRRVTNWITKDSGRYYAWVQVERVRSLPADATYEDYPASYDLVSINWDPNVFTYVANGVSNNNMWLADADQRNKGTILFNMYDNLSAGVETVSAYAKLSAKKAQLTTTAVKYTHTYDKTEKTTTYTGSANWKWGNAAEVGVNYSVTETNIEANWTKAETANVTTTLESKK